MFNKLKQYKDLRSQAKSMQDELAKETITAEKNGIKIDMDGNMKVTSVSISKELSHEQIQSSMAECINDAIKKAQKQMAQKMQEMGGMPGMQ
ncbi:MAG TPA: YbaB/EbfC family nucleoid-associated protein [Patescibacteria group bacterium]|nr:YbaB/EbfC family nucleoid-associated protein [Patescibacteria group bacterium]